MFQCRRRTWPLAFIVCAAGFLGLGSVALWLYRCGLRILPPTAAPIVLTPAGVADADGHIWRLNPCGERYRFAEVVEAYRKLEKPSGRRGPMFLGIAHNMALCARKGETFNSQDVMRYLGTPDYVGTVPGIGDMLFYSYDHHGDADGMVWLTLDPNGNVVAATWAPRQSLPTSPMWPPTSNRAKGPQSGPAFDVVPDHRHPDAAGDDDGNQ